MDADYTFYVKSIETDVRAFLPFNISAVSSVFWLQQIQSKVWGPSRAYVQAPISRDKYVHTLLRVPNGKILQNLVAFSEYMKFTK